MYNVINKIKNGNKVVYEVKSDSGEIKQLNKDELVREIQSNNVSNARIQNYKGQLIIRLKENTSTQRNKESNNKIKKQTILAIELFKNISKCFGIQTIEEALAVGFDKYELDEEIDISDRKRIIELSYNMAVDIKQIADTQNNRLLASYKKAFDSLK